MGVRDNGIRLAQQLNIGTTNIQTMLGFLRQRPVNDLIVAAGVIMTVSINYKS